MNNHLLKHIGHAFMLAAFLTGAVSSCTEDIDMSNRYTFTEYTVLSYLEDNEEYSDYVDLLHKVNISSMSESTVAQLLSARGHFTCFAPTNDAIQAYLEELYNDGDGIMTAPTLDGFKDDQERDSIYKVIVYNSIIDGGDVEYYETATFPKNDNDEFFIANMNDRKLSVVRGKVNSDSIYINGIYPIDLKNRDIEAINGRIHQMAAVIAPSNDTMRDLLLKWIEANEGNFIVMSKLLLACGLDDTLNKVRDEVWENLYIRGQIEDIGDFDSSNPQSGLAPEHRKYGFTIFAETDEVWERIFPGKSASEITPDDVYNYLRDKQGIDPNYDHAAENDYHNVNNLLNLFVTYHILPMRISRDKLVVHYNEKGYNYSSSRNPTVATAEYYTTLGRPRLLKVYESYESHGIYLNRFPILRNGRGNYSPENLNINDYHESGFFYAVNDPIEDDNSDNEGILVEAGTEPGALQASPLNGNIFPIKKLLIYSTNVQTQLMRQRIRFDMASILSEMMSNDIRRPLTNYPTLHASYRGFPTSYQYFDNIELKEGTRFYYLNGLGRNWYNWQGDEFNIIGRYEFVIKLPPVPKEGHYELRLAVQSNSHLRGMCQVYWGADRNNLPAVGIPLDMRMGGEWRRLSSGSDQPSIVGWEADTDDAEHNDEIDKKMRNNGFMKGPEHFCPNPANQTTTARTVSDHTRRIMVSAYMSPNEVYYIKFKSVLEDATKQFFIDYIEYCAKEVYDNPEMSEDIW